MKMYRIEKDTMGEVRVDDSRHWGAQTQRSLENFPISCEKMPEEIIVGFAVLKKAAALANAKLGKLPEKSAGLISEICDEIIAGEHMSEFPLKVWQTGSGTQSNMNMNEVIAHFANEREPGLNLHPNDHANMSQSSNDTFPTAMNIAAVCSIRKNLIPAIDSLESCFENLEKKYENVIKIGRTHLQDATPLKFSQEISAYSEMLRENRKMLTESLSHLYRIALGGTAVGTGLNAPEGFDRESAKMISEITGFPFVTSPNKFHALTSKDAFVFAHGALTALACNMMKIANDVRWSASGPRCGFSEIFIPENEPGSSIMPGKVNPTQCESMTMVCTQVMSNNQAVAFAACQGNFQLNVFMPVCAHNFLQSVRLLSDGIKTFEKNCASGIRANEEKMKANLENSLMLVTCLSPAIGYDKAAKIAKYAHKNGLSLKQAALESGFVDEETFDMRVKPENMV